MKIRYKIYLIFFLISTSILISLAMNYEYNYYKSIKGVYSNKINMVFLNPSVVHIFNNDDVSKTVYIGRDQTYSRNNELNYTIPPKEFKDFYIYGSFSVCFYYYHLDDFQYFDFFYLDIAGWNWEEDEAVYYTYVISWSHDCNIKYSETIETRDVYNGFGISLIVSLVWIIFIVIVGPENEKNLKSVTNENT